MKFRYHRELLSESMDTLIEGTRKDIVAKLRAEGYAGITFEAYDNRPDRRIGWNQTYIVMGQRDGGPKHPIGFSDTDH